MQGVHAGGRGVAVGGGAGGARSLIDVLAVDVDCVRAEGGAAVAAAGVALLEAEELDLGLEALHECGGHGCGVVCS